jgi:MarR family transcriptional regulator, organic hydroperoxide resistance regulator
MSRDDHRGAIFRLHTIESLAIKLLMDGSDHLRLDEQLCFALYAASRAVVQTYGPLLEPLGLTYPQYLVMLVLWEDDGPSVKRLGERLHLDSGTLTPLLKRLEARKLVERRRASADERVVHIHLTAQGRALRRKAAAIPREILRCSQLSIDELGRLRDELATLTCTLRDERAA